MGIIQEKYDYVAPVPPASDNEWATPSSARRSTRATGLTLPKLNLESGKFGQSTSGNMPSGKGAGDVSQDVNRKSLRKGYDYKLMRPTDDQYTREHNDAFYDFIKVDGVEGFVERNNVLDRS